VVLRLDPQSPHEHSRGYELNDAVCAERLKHKTMRGEPGTDGDGRFDDHPCYGQPFESQRGGHVGEPHWTFGAFCEAYPLEISQVRSA
jgi:hypothetical protein